MNRVEHLLVILAEECSEVQKDACKALRFGLDDRQPGQSKTNLQRLAKEALIEMLDLDLKVRDVEAKKKRVERFMKLSKKLGTLHD